MARWSSAARIDGDALIAENLRAQSDFTPLPFARLFRGGNIRPAVALPAPHAGSAIPQENHHATAACWKLSSAL